MNPGSSQFASQFPDAEETMSKMESKKLKTSLARLDELNTLVDRGEFNFIPAPDACKLDDELNALVFHLVTALRLHAQEQREIIRKLDAQVAALANWVNAHDCNPAVNHLLMRAREARAAAAPYLRED